MKILVLPVLFSVWSHSVEPLQPGGSAGTEIFEITTTPTEFGVVLGCTGERKQDRDEILELFSEDKDGLRELARLDLDTLIIQNTRDLFADKLNLRSWPAACISGLVSEFGEGQLETKDDKGQSWGEYVANGFQQGAGWGHYSSGGGCTCPQGLPGVDGPSGDDGPEGEEGEAGRDGVNGLDGRLGRDGSTGEGGNKGEKGVRGERGQSGPKGEDGGVGPQGRPGRDGRRLLVGTVLGEKTPGQDANNGTSKIEEVIPIIFTIQPNKVI